MKKWLERSAFAVAGLAIGVGAVLAVGTPEERRLDALVEEISTAHNELIDDVERVGKRSSQQHSEINTLTAENYQLKKEIAAAKILKEYGLAD